MYPCRRRVQFMVIGQKLRVIREAKNLSQRDIERRTGLLRCYISRVEHGHTVPAVETLEKFARAFEVPFYQLFHDGIQPIEEPNLPAANKKSLHEASKDRRELRRFAEALSRMSERNRKLLLSVAQR